MVLSNPKKTLETKQRMNENDLQQITEIFVIFPPEKYFLFSKFGLEDFFIRKIVDSRQTLPQGEG